MPGTPPEVLVITVLVVIFAAYILGRLMLNTAEDKLLFRAIREHQAEPNIPHENFWLPGGAHGWWFRNHPGKPTVLYYHGSGGNISYYDHIIGIFHSQRLNLLIFDYRGYGRSPGNSSTQGILADSLQAYDWLTERVPPKELIIWGESMDSSAALYSLKERRAPVLGLVLAGAYSRPSEVAAEKIHKIFGLLAYTHPELDNLHYLQSVTCPVAIIHSPGDQIIPYSQALDLYKNVKHNCRRLITISGSHSRPDISVEKLEEVLGFFHLPCERCDEAEPFLRRICNDKRQCFELPA